MFKIKDSRFFRDPAGWTSDVCPGAAQRPCVPGYFKNALNVGFRFNTIKSTNFTDVNTPFQYAIDRPFFILGLGAPASQYMTGDPGTNTSIYPWGDSPLLIANEFAYMPMISKLFQNMMETTVNNEGAGVPMGLSYDKSVGYNKTANTGVNMNYYFNNYNSEGQIFNLESFILPMQMLGSFWTWVQSQATLEPSQVAWDLMPKFASNLIAMSDLRLWGAPGIYTVDPTNLAPWIQTGDPGGLRNIMSSVYDDEQGPILFIIEQKSVE